MPSVPPVDVKACDFYIYFCRFNQWWLTVGSAAGNQKVSRCQSQRSQTRISRRKKREYYDGGSEVEVLGFV